MRALLASCSDLPTWEVDDRPFHDALRRRGVDVVVAPWDDAGVDASAFDVCLIRTTWDYQERQQEFVEWARQTATKTRFFNPPSVIEWNTHKAYLREIEAAGVPTLETCWIDRGDAVDVGREVSTRDWAGGFVKPAIGATARETLRFEASSDGIAAAQAHVDRLTTSEDLLLQPYCASVERDGEASVILIDGVATHAVRKRPVAGDYRVQDDFGASDEAEAIDAELESLARTAMAVAPGDLLYCRADFLRDNAGQWCLTELEVVEPSLFFRHGPNAADALADALMRRTEAQVSPSE